MRIRHRLLGLALVLGAGSLSAQTAPPQARRAQPGPQQTATAAEAPAARYHLLVRGSLPAAKVVSALIEEVQLKHPSTPDEVKGLLQNMRFLEGMPNRISMNVSVPRQTQRAAPGERAASNMPGGAAASAGYAATGKAPARDIVIVLCDSREEEAQAQQLIPPQLEAARVGGRPSAGRSAAAGSSDSRVLRLAAPGGVEWVWISGDPLP